VLLYGRFGSPHYAMPIVLPAVIVAAPVFDRWRRTRIIAFVLAIALAGQIVLFLSERTKGGAAEAMAVARDTGQRLYLCVARRLSGALYADP
jgi:hypothetical protein